MCGMVILCGSLLLCHLTILYGSVIHCGLLVILHNMAQSKEGCMIKQKYDNFHAQIYFEHKISDICNVLTNRLRILTRLGTLL